MFGNILSKNFSNTSASKKSFSSSSCHLIGNDSIFNYSYRASQFIQYYLQASPVFTATNLISGKFASIAPILKDVKKNEFVTDHPVLELLKKPSPFIDSELFMTALASDYNLTGNVYLNIVGPTKPVELQLLKPQNITIQANNRDGYPERYDHNSSNSNSFSYIRDRNDKFIAENGNEIGQLRTYNPIYCSNDLFGISRFKGCELEISQYILANVHNNSLLKNQGRPSGLVTYKGNEDLDQDSINITKEIIRQAFSGAENAGKTAILNGDFDWKQMSESIKDMDFATLEDRMEKAVYKAVHVPLTYVSDEAGTRDNKVTAKLDLYDNSIIPLANRIFGFLNRVLMPRYPNSENLVLTFDQAAINELKTRQIDNALKISQSGVLTINEIRTPLGYDALTEGGDVLYQPGNLVPVASDQFTDDNRETPSKRKAIFIKIMKDGGYSDEVIKQAIDTHYGNNKL